MTQEVFTAATQYNDWTGSAAADDTDHVMVGAWLVENGYMNEGEFIVGLDVDFGTNIVTEDPGPVYLSALIFEDADGLEKAERTIQNSQGPITVKKISIEITQADFFALFKRLNITISRKGILSPGTEYIFEEKS